jgi:hypothetical protein
MSTSRSILSRSHGAAAALIALALLASPALAGPGRGPPGSIDRPVTTHDGPPGADNEPPGAQDGPPGSIDRPADRRPARRERLRQRVREMRAWYLSEKLRLDEATARRLFSLLDEFDDRLDELHRRGVQLRRALRRATAAAAGDDAAIDRLVDDLLAHYEDLYRVQRARLVAVRRVVTPAQVAKLVILLPQLDDAIRKQIQRALRGRDRPGDLDDDRRPRRRRHRDRRGPPPNAPPFTDPF